MFVCLFFKCFFSCVSDEQQRRIRFELLFGLVVQRKNRFVFFCFYLFLFFFCFCFSFFVFFADRVCLFLFFFFLRGRETDGPDSGELVGELTEKLLAGKKSEVFALLQTLPAARAQRLKERLIDNLKRLPGTAIKSAGGAATTTTTTTTTTASRSDERPRSAVLEKKSTPAASAAAAAAGGEKDRTKSMEVKKTVSTPSSPSMGGKQTRSVCGGRYLLGECVGRGNFGRVYNALDKNTGQFVAVKEIGCSNFNKAAISAIMLEADLLSSLDHKNIVKNLEVDQTEDYIFFVMELISRCPKKILYFVCFLKNPPPQRIFV